MSIWTTERVQILRDAWEGGHTAAEIAELLGLSPNAVGGKIYRLNLAKRRSVRRGRVAPARPRPIPESRRLTILELEPLLCRWPQDEDDGALEEGRFSFCGHDCADGYSYCPAHVLVAYRAEEKLVRKIDIQLAEAA